MGCVQKKILTPPRYLVSEVIKSDGTKVIFEKPCFLIEKNEFGDNSGRMAQGID